ncbi:MAG: putative sensor domain DACNV-containing protein [Polyangiaceae bacterium]|jgi:hypothetical protein
MTDRYAYPNELASFVRDAWPADATPLPAGLEELLSNAYQATLLRDEERQVTFRIVVAPPESFPPGGGPPRGMLRLVFDQPRPFDAGELRRLSPAVKYARSLIGVAANAQDGGFSIWGIVHSGPRWLERTQGGRSLPPEIPGAPLVVRAAGPGLISVARGDRTVAELRGGAIARPGVDVFASHWFPARFAKVREELFSLHQNARASAPDPWGELDPDLVRVLSVHMVKRLIATMRAGRHGGALVLVPPDCDTSRYLHLKYAFNEEEPRRRHRTLVLAAMRALARLAAAESLGKPAGWRDYASETRDPFPAIDEAIFEISHMLASLADVDGAVVLSTRWEVLGFSAEIIGDLPDVPRVAIARDVEATRRTFEATDGVGTRHRSAYRLCAALHDAIAIVVSQDGAVRWVAWNEGEVTCWDHVPTDASGD